VEANAAAVGRRILEASETSASEAPSAAATETPTFGDAEVCVEPTNLTLCGPLVTWQIPATIRASCAELSAHPFMRWSHCFGFARRHWNTPLCRPPSVHASAEEEIVAAVHACTRGSAIQDEVLRYKSESWLKRITATAYDLTDNTILSCTLDGLGGQGFIRAHQGLLMAAALLPCAAHFPVCIVSTSRTAFIERRYCATCHRPGAAATSRSVAFRAAGMLSVGGRVQGRAELSGGATDAGWRTPLMQHAVCGALQQDLRGRVLGGA
jgi:hypothetical protein